MVEEEDEAAARREHARDLGNRRFVVGDVFEHQARDRGVETRGGEGQVLGEGSHIARATTAFGRDLELGAGRVDTRDVGAESRREAGDLSLTGPDVDDTLRAVEAFGREGQDLLFVLRVDTVGEAVLPPARVLLPEFRRRGFGPVIGHGSG